MSHTVDLLSIPMLLTSGASPDARVCDPSAVPCFGIAEVKCQDISSISGAGHLKMVNGRAKLKNNHKYHWQVQGQLAVT